MVLQNNMNLLHRSRYIYDSVFFTPIST